MTGPRREQTATLLADGRVLVAGGSDADGAPLASAELYDPQSGNWTVTGSMREALVWHAAVLLHTGKVLAVGQNHAELFDPISGTWTVTNPMSQNRGNLSTVTVLRDGRVLVAGGGAQGGCAVDSAELFDPTGGTWTPTGSMATGRVFHTATLLDNGRVLVAGGQGGLGCDVLASSEIFDPISGRWSAAGDLVRARVHHVAIPLPDGKVLVSGGEDALGSAMASAELFDEATSEWHPAADMIDHRTDLEATLLANGGVLVTGGHDDNGTVLNPLGSAEVYDPVGDSWTAAADLVPPRIHHTATLLANGTVLVAGGQSSSAPYVLTSAVLYGSGGGT